MVGIVRGGHSVAIGQRVRHVGAPRKSIQAVERRNRKINRRRLWAIKQPQSPSWIEGEGIVVAPESTADVCLRSPPVWRQRPDINATVFPVEVDQVESSS